jgi:hypothetical protein
MKRSLAAALMGAWLCAAALAGCGHATASLRAPATPPAVPGLDTAGPDMTGVNIQAIVVPNLSGPVSRPNSQLTPGAVSVTDIQTVCTQLAGLRVSPPFTVQQTIYAEYGYTTTAQQHKYLLDYLVPLSLGGSTARANIWPAAVAGVGFFQKQQLNHVITDLVCHGAVPLATAQSLIAQNWYSTWLRYVVAAGRA